MRPITALVTRMLAGLGLVVALVLSEGASAAPDAEFRAFVEGVWAEARAQGVKRATFDAAFAGVEPDLTLPDLVLPGQKPSDTKGQAEFIKPPQDYLHKGYLAKLTEQGKVFMVQHAASLAKIEATIGVDRTAVVAIWGRETAFGTFRLPHYAIKALATQAYLGRRKEFFRKELVFALKMLEDRIVDIPGMKSSWAGAMGLTQFMPSEFYQYAVDLDGDGRADLFNSVPDALASAAKQLKQKGWRQGETWGYEVRLPAGVDCTLEGPSKARPIADWVRAGVVRTGGRTFRPDQLRQEAYLLTVCGAYGPAFLVTENFKVIKRYNTADLYALFVGHLADRVAGGGDFETPWSAGLKQLATRDIEEIQTRLIGLGAPLDKADGRAGVLTRSEVGRYQRSRSLPVDCWPSPGVLGHLRTQATR